MKKFAFLIFLSLSVLTACHKGDKSLKPRELKTEQKVNPKGIETAEPRFSWIIGGSERGIYQSAYQILVASDPSLLNEKKADMWNSGKVNSGQSVLVPYEGTAPESRNEYFWKVRIWDDEGKVSEYSKVASWEMGITDQDDWKARWIAADLSGEAMKNVPHHPDRLRSVLLRKEFELGPKIRKARAYVTGLGNYILYLNGEKVSSDLLTPGWTDYHKRVQYQVYDVTDMLQKGENAAGIMLGNMWWSSGLGWKGAAKYSEGPLRALMQLEVEYENGDTETYITDKSWKGNFSPVVDNSLYHGETYDARLEIPFWSEPGLEDSHWFEVEEIPFKISLSYNQGPPIQVEDTIRPVSVKEVKPGVFVYDMGVNMVGFVNLKVNGENGDTVVLRFAELLHEDGTVAQENLRSALATDKYILAGDGEESWQPHFTYHGFRYVQVEGLAGNAEKENITGLRFYSSAPVTGNFSSSNEMLNRVWANVMNGQKGNMMSVPTDCPQRDERLGWMGDAQIFAPSSCYNMDMAAFYNKWMRDITDSQDEDSGYVYDVNPAIVVGGPSKAGWGDAVVIIPWVVYNFYGDKKIIEDNYKGMKAWVDYMKKKSENHIYRWSNNEGEWEGYGDWISVEKSPTEPISAAYYFYSTKLLSQMAGLTGHTDDEKYYASLADSIAVAFHKKFFDEKTLNYPGATQTANLIPLTFGLTPDSLHERVAENIYENILEKDYHPTTGFLGTNILLPRLSDYGYHQAAYQTAANEEYPSWIYMVKNGATSVWELWNSDKEKPEGMNSRNHFALGAIAEWFYGYLAGIRPLEPGFKKSLIAPLPAEGLDHAEATIGTPYGPLSSSWEVNNNILSLDVEIPANTRAVLVIPGWEKGKVLEDGEGNILLDEQGKLNGNPYISATEYQSEGFALELLSGTYSFTLKQ